MKIVSINVGRPRQIRWQGQLVQTSIFKSPVSGRVRVRHHNFDGDEQSDLTVHGGVHKAVYVYPSEHYPFWQRELPEMDLTWGNFGENLTTKGLLEDKVHIGDALRIGSTEFIVTQPRLPCFKLGIRFNRPDMVKRFQLSGRSGFYLSIAREGEVGPDDEVAYVAGRDDSISVAAIFRLYTADDEALPLADESFDAVLSSFGVMFVPNHVRVANELVRVCRSKGRIGLANWTPGGFVGRLFAAVGRYATPPAAFTPPARWGTDEYLDRLFGSSASSIRTTRRHFVFRYRSAEHWIDVFRTWYGPVHRAFTSLPPESQRCLEEDLIDLIDEFNHSGDSTMVVPSEYLEAVIVKR